MKRQTTPAFHGAQRSVTCLALAALGSLVQPSAAQQCFGPDGFSGSCCEEAAPSLPDFVDFSLPSLAVRWDKCQPESTSNLKLSFSTLIEGLCGQFSSTATVTAPNGNVLLSGNAVLDYTRTWREFQPNGDPVQIWRLAVKADLDGLWSANGPQFIPSCLDGTRTAFYYGYVDYASPCPGNGSYRNVAVLQHQCDRFIHTNLSDFPGPFHPEESYSLVAPHTPVNPFVPALTLAPGGALVGDGMRRVGTAGDPACMSEEPVVTGTLAPYDSVCLCAEPVDPMFAQHTSLDLSGRSSCMNALGEPGRFRARDLFPRTPWRDLIATSLGAWSTNATYPGQEFAWVNEGLLGYRDSCAEEETFEIFYGGSTSNGWPVEGLPQCFLDLASNFQKVPGVAAFLPAVGSIRDTYHLVYVNF